MTLKDLELKLILMKQELQGKIKASKFDKITNPEIFELSSQIKFLEKKINFLKEKEE